MAYKPEPATVDLLDRAWGYVQSVAYTVTARWVFYRLLQDGTFSAKADYKKLLAVLSHARKNFYGEWKPNTLADDTRAAILMQRRGYYTLFLRGSGFDGPEAWLKRVTEELNCPLDRWKEQPRYVEVWFEAAAMQSQFLFYLDENIPLLAFHGDVSIPAKWDAAERLVKRWKELHKPTTVLYYGDLDPKGLSIPESARKDVLYFCRWQLLLEARKRGDANWKDAADAFTQGFQFRRVGLNRQDVGRLNVPENPERPGTWQWEGLDDDAAQELIGRANGHIDKEAFARVKAEEEGITQRFRSHLEDLIDEIRNGEEQL